jgi:hypothetical protein
MAAVPLGVDAGGDQAVHVDGISQVTRRDRQHHRGQ